MNTKLKKQAHSRLTPDQIRPLMEDFDKQGKSVKEFCQAYGICDGTFYNWRKKYCSGHNNSSSGFTEIIPALSPAEPIREKLFAQVREIYIYQPVSTEYLKSLLS
jgi:transposase-like protein